MLGSVLDKGQVGRGPKTVFGSVGKGGGGYGGELEKGVGDRKGQFAQVRKLK